MASTKALKEAKRLAEIAKAEASGNKIPKRLIHEIKANEQGYYCNPAGKTYCMKYDGMGGNQFFSLKPTSAILKPANPLKSKEREKTFEEAVKAMGLFVSELKNAKEIFAVEINKEFMSVIFYKDEHGIYQGLKNHPCRVDTNEPDFNKGDILIVTPNGLEMICLGLKKKQRKLSSFTYCVVGICSYQVMVPIPIAKCPETLQLSHITNASHPLIVFILNNYHNLPRLHTDKLKEVQIIMDELLKSKELVKGREVVHVQVRKDVMLLASNESFTRTNEDTPYLTVIGAVNIPEGSDIRSKLFSFGNTEQYVTDKTKADFVKKRSTKPYMYLRTNKIETRSIVDGPLYFDDVRHMPDAVLTEPIPNGKDDEPIPIMESDKLCLKKSFNLIKSFSSIMGKDAPTLAKMPFPAVRDFVVTSQQFRSNHLKRLRELAEEKQTLQHEVGEVEQPPKKKKKIDQEKEGGESKKKDKKQTKPKVKKTPTKPKTESKPIFEEKDSDDEEGEDDDEEEEEDEDDAWS